MSKEKRTEQQRVPMTPTTKARVDKLYREHGISIGDLVAFAAYLFDVVEDEDEQEQS